MVVEVVVELMALPLDLDLAELVVVELVEISQVVRQEQ
tara:strand:+ start:537 stop:650 length:114 start_codon:yes stop_codon:yes gene_type:complete